VKLLALSAFNVSCMETMWLPSDLPMALAALPGAPDISKSGLRIFEKLLKELPLEALGSCSI
jgi:hypothetical protein